MYIFCLASTISDLDFQVFAKWSLYFVLSITCSNERLNLQASNDRYYFFSFLAVHLCAKLLVFLVLFSTHRRRGWLTGELCGVWALFLAGLLTLVWESLLAFTFLYFIIFVCSCTRAQTLLTWAGDATTHRNLLLLLWAACRSRASMRDL